MARVAVCLVAMLAIASVVAARDTITLAQILSNSLFSSYTSAVSCSSFRGARGICPSWTPRPAVRPNDRG